MTKPEHLFSQPDYYCAMDLGQFHSLRSLKGPVMVTGHTGFKGTWLTLLLERLGLRVVGYSLPAAPQSLYDRAGRLGSISETFADIRDFESLQMFVEEHQPSSIFHLAAQPLVLESYRVPRYTFDVNVMGTANLLEAALNIDSVRSVIVATTDKVYRNQENGKAFVENDDLWGSDPYSSSKVAAECAVTTWQKLSTRIEGPKITSVRAGNVIGGGDWAENRLLPDIIRSAIQQKELRIRNPQSTRPWQHVLDPLHGYVLTLVAHIQGENIDALNFGPDGSSLTVGSVANIALESLDYSIRFDEKVLLDTKSVPTESSYLDLDSSFAKSALKWTAKWTQIEAVKSTATWWRNHLIENTHAIDLCNRDLDFLLSDTQ